MSCESLSYTNYSLLMLQTDVYSDSVMTSIEKPFLQPHQS